MSEPEPSEIAPLRRSKCAEESRLVERERVRAMTLEERMLEALSLYETLSRLEPAPYRAVER